ncbi:hypothetical protein BC938DRAFT_480983 [Jimgerdemannia flammicorona]|uniref:Uncharacterized protein n=1 Tax=Jimgerdemannia flammicorona TaxID=994334 RepID=A0A433QHY8_9FUNG|nr:hypothetical protein BC938DRAFT_480983 [Jimgerdemannia flammicorona]
MSAKTIYTIGHSTHPLPTFLSLLHSHAITHLIDVRSYTKSQRNPQFHEDTLTRELRPQGIGYTQAKDLGGLRKKKKGETWSGLNDGWRSESFRAYAEYMMTEKFWTGIEKVEGIGVEEAEKGREEEVEEQRLGEEDMGPEKDGDVGGRVAYMCAEIVPFRCHRHLISDALTVRGWTVLHIYADARHTLRQHTISSFARVDPTTLRITYPLAVYKEEGEDDRSDEERMEKEHEAHIEVPKRRVRAARLQGKLDGWVMKGEVGNAETK